MTTHPEDAMTRERALDLAYTALCEFATTLPDPADSAHARRIADMIEPALASAPQEPAPSADAEEIARETYEVILAAAGHHNLDSGGSIAVLDGVKSCRIIAAALRRYAGDGGVWQPIETAPRDGSIILIDSKPDEPTWLPFAARLIPGHYDFPPGTVWIAAPPRVRAADRSAT